MGGIFFVLGLAFTVGFLLIFATSLSAKKKAGQESSSDQQSLPSFDRFVRICEDLTDAMKLEIEQMNVNQEDHTVDIYAQNPTPITGGRYLIHSVLASPERTISAAEIVELSNAIIQDRLSKGIFITTAQFTSDLPAISELAPMEFIDGAKLKELAERYRIPLQTPV